MFGVAAIGLALVFGRLGLWQLHRLEQRRTFNAERRARLALASIDLSGTTTGGPEALDPEVVSWRRIRTMGDYDYSREIVLRARTSLGTPGVYVVTPLRLDDGTGVLVLRGWMPARDGLSAELGAARPAARKTRAQVLVEGLALPLEPETSIPPRRHRFDAGEHWVLSSLSAEQVREVVPYPLAGVYVLADGTGSAPVAVPAPRLTDGPHLLYAVQWFAFAAISLIGAGVYVRRGEPAAIHLRREGQR